MGNRYNIHEAKTHFSKLVSAVERGDRVTICRNGEPVMVCVPVSRERRSFPFGVWASRHTGATLDHLADPTDEELLDAMGL